MIVKTGNKSLSSSFSVNPDPYPFIKKAKENGQWFEGFALSVTYFEHYGLKKILTYCESNKISKELFKAVFGREVERMGANQIISILFYLKIIKENSTF